MSDEISDNPFCTRYVRPGAIPFLFPSGEDAEALVRRLEDNRWRGEIIGGHGSGKSALLATLTASIERAGRSVTLVELHDGQRRLPAEATHDGGLRPATVLAIDGYEQLSRWRRWLLERRCRRRGAGLLVTAHVSVGLPRLYQTAPTAEVTERIVEHLLAGRSPPFTTAEITACFARRHGDVRETLFDLYDLCEQRRASASY